MLDRDSLVAQPGLKLGLVLRALRHLADDHGAWHLSLPGPEPSCSHACNDETAGRDVPPLEFDLLVTRNVDDLGAGRDDHTSSEHGPFADLDALDHDDAGAQEGPVADDHRAGAGRFEDPADTDATSDVDVAADLGAGADGRPGVHHGASADASADVHEARHHDDALLEMRAVAQHGPGHDTNIVGGPLERDLVPVFDGAALHALHRTECEVEKDGLLGPGMHDRTARAGRSDTHRALLEVVDGVEHRLLVGRVIEQRAVREGALDHAPPFGVGLVLRRTPSDADFRVRYVAQEAHRRVVFHGVPELTEEGLGRGALVLADHEAVASIRGQRSEEGSSRVPSEPDRESERGTLPRGVEEPHGPNLRFLAGVAEGDLESSPVVADGTSEHACTDHPNIISCIATRECAEHDTIDSFSRQRDTLKACHVPSLSLASSTGHF